MMTSAVSTGEEVTVQKGRTEGDVLDVGLDLREADGEGVLRVAADVVVRRDLEVVTRLNFDNVGQDLFVGRPKSAKVVCNAEGHNIRSERPE